MRQIALITGFFFAVLSIGTPFIVSCIDDQQYCVEICNSSGEESENKNIEEIDIDEYTFENHRFSFSSQTRIKQFSSKTLAEITGIVSTSYPPPEC